MTDTQQHEARCGVEDSGLFGATPNKWILRDLNYLIESRPTGPNLNEIKVDGAIERAFWFWSQVCPFKFTRTTNPAVAHVLIRTIPLDPTFAATAQMPGPDWATQRIVSLNSLKQFSVGISVNTVKLENVLGHEFGHILGLTHSENPQSLMYSGVVNFDRPQPEDIARIQEMYGPAVTPPPPPPPPPVDPIPDVVDSVIVWQGHHYAGKLKRIS